MSMPAEASDAEVRAVLALLAPVAARRSGYLVAGGRLTRLDGVPAPPPAARTEERERELPPPFRLFLTARLDLGVTSGTEGWHRVVRHLGQLLHDDRARDLTPNLILDRDGAWQPFDQHGSAPPWWPARQRLARHRPRVVWELYGAGFPADRFSGITGKMALGTEHGDLLLARLAALAPLGLQYGMVHAWTPREPTGDTGFLPASRQAHDPRLGIGDRRTGLATYLPNLYWGQVFGPPWVALFGAEALASAPAHRVEELPGGCWLVQLTERMSDLETDYDRYAEVRDACKRHLGADCFYDPARGEDGSYRAPDLPDLADRGLVAPPALEELGGR
jgi:hypothetical protein